MAEAQPASPAAASNFPIVSDARLAGDAKQTRFVLDLDKTIRFHAFALADPYRVVMDIPQVSFQLPAGTGTAGRGLVKAFRYGLVMPGGSRIVFDLTGPAKIANSYVLEAANGQPPRLVLELEDVDRTTFVQSLAPENRPELRPAIADANAAVPAGSGGVAQARGGSGFTPRGRDRSGPWRHRQRHPGRRRKRKEPGAGIWAGVARSDREIRQIPRRHDPHRRYLHPARRPGQDRAQSSRAALFVSIHADALPRREGDAQGATIYTLSDRASDAEAERLAEAENKADAIGGVNLTEEPTEVADILIDLAQRETRTFSNRFARLLMGEMKSTVRMHKHPLKSAGFKVLKAPDVPSVLIELGYVSNKGDLEHMVSENWRNRTVGSMAQAIDVFLAKRLATAGPAN